MSWQAMEAVQDHSELEDYLALCIMYALARSADENGVVGAGGRATSPNIDTLAERAHCHRNTVLNWLPKLEESGELKVERFGKGRGSWNRYTILLPMPDNEIEANEAQPDPIQQLTEMVQALAEMVQEQHDAIPEMVQETVQNSLSHVGLDTKDTKKKPPSKSPLDSNSPQFPAELDSTEFAEAWLDWITHREQLGARPYTPKSMNYLLGQWAERGQRRTVQAIHHSIMHGWKSLHEPDDNGSGPKSEHSQTANDESGGVHV